MSEDESASTLPSTNLFVPSDNIDTSDFEVMIFDILLHVGLVHFVHTREMERKNAKRMEQNGVHRITHRQTTTSKMPTTSSNNTTTHRPRRISISTIVQFCLIGYLYIYVLLTQHANKIHENTGIQQENGTPPRLSIENSHFSSSFQRRLQRLESKLNTYLGFGVDPFLSTRMPAKCKKSTKLEENKYCGLLAKQEKDFANKPCHLGMYVCLDDFPPKESPCVVYDFGIRQEPEFGLIMAHEKLFNCEVHAFDPSPISTKWYKTQTLKYSKAANDNPNYQFHPYGGGGADENLELKEYNWDQVSVYHYPSYVTNGKNCTAGHCRYHKFPIQKVHQLPVRTVDSVMKELGHKRIDILKLDVEGSEYRMLEHLIESGACRNVDQLTLEWHHYDYDLRYGASSTPMLNVLVKLLDEECGLVQFWLHDPTGWPSNEELYTQMGIVLRYNLAAFKRVRAVQ